MIFAMVTGPHPRCPLPPHPNPPPRRGEGRVGVMRLEIFMQRLGKDRENQAKHKVSFSLAQRAFLDPWRIIAQDVSHRVRRKDFIV